MLATSATVAITHPSWVVCLSNWWQFQQVEVAHFAMAGLMVRLRVSLLMSNVP